MSTIQPVTAVPTASLSLEQRVQALELKVKTTVDTDVSAAEKWLKANWPHFITWLGVAYAAMKHL
jgi:hypothetical protein